MLFIGHFSFDEIDADSQPKHGYFSSIVDAKSPDVADHEMLNDGSFIEAKPFITFDH